MPGSCLQKLGNCAGEEGMLRVRQQSRSRDNTCCNECGGGAYGGKPTGTELGIVDPIAFGNFLYGQCQHAVSLGKCGSHGTKQSLQEEILDRTHPWERKDPFLDFLPGQQQETEYADRNNHPQPKRATWCGVETWILASLWLLISVETLPNCNISALPRLPPPHHMEDNWDRFIYVCIYFLPFF